MKNTERQQHNTQIYQEWLDGADIAALARKHRHTRRTIESIVRGATCRQLVVRDEWVANAQQWQEKAKQWKEFAAVNAAQANELAELAAHYRYCWIKMQHGKRAARAWLRNQKEGEKALNAKLKVFSANGITAKRVYDNLGLVVDFVPMPLSAPRIMNTQHERKT